MNGNTRSITLKAALLLWIAATGLVSADDAVSHVKPADREKISYGIAIDLLPTVMSMSAGKAGGSLQAWVGKDHTRVRLVGATMRFPDSMIDNEQFTDRDLKCVALLVDHFRNDDFTGWWSGGGVEYWSNEITNKVSGDKANWDNTALTAGGGYIHPINEHLYVEPWVGLHYTLSQKGIDAGGARYEPKRLAAEISVKVGMRW